MLIFYAECDDHNYIFAFFVDDASYMILYLPRWLQVHWVCSGKDNSLWNTWGYRNKFLGLPNSSYLSVLSSHGTLWEASTLKQLSCYHGMKRWVRVKGLSVVVVLIEMVFCLLVCSFFLHVMHSWEELKGLHPWHHCLRTSGPLLGYKQEVKVSHPVTCQKLIST